MTGLYACFFIVLLSAPVPLLSQSCESYNSSCAQCISSSTECYWCGGENKFATGCFNVGTGTCPQGDRVNPDSVVNVVTHPPEDNRQVSVESVRMRLRVGETKSFTFNVRSAENFPLDFYVLMDLSRSFEQDLVTVKEVAPQIADALANLTKQFSVGMGVFVDKETHPFNSLRALQLSFPNGSACQPEASDPDFRCSVPVSYEHAVNLTNSAALFRDSVQNLSISASVDAPEGTLDALMQAIVCTDVVGWRGDTVSRKIIMVMTDAFMHIAGDGGLVGIYRSNDGKCRTQRTEDGRVLYTASTEYDYPSLDQIRQTLNEFQVRPVFAIRDVQVLRNYYSNIATSLDALVEIISPNSDNLVSVIQQAYNEIVSRSRVQVLGERDYVRFGISVVCPDGSNKTDDITCDNIGNSTVVYTLNVTLLSCPENLRNFGTEQVTVNVPSFGRFQIQLEGFCNCDCERMPSVNNDLCLMRGNLSCGQCNCPPEWTGNDCSCSTASCTINTANNLECGGSNLGNCVCGKCVCLGSRLGDSCECEDSVCRRSSSEELCSGHGECSCERGCQCELSTLTGRPQPRLTPFCSCPEDDCVNPVLVNTTDCDKYSNCTVCNGRGECTCNTNGDSICDCNDGFVGRYCEASESDQLCIATEVPCVTCIAVSDASTISRCEGQCPGDLDRFIKLESRVPDTYRISGAVTGTRLCTHFDGTCTYRYFKGTLNSGLRIEVPPPDCLLLPVWAIGVIILVVLLLLGILILIAVKLLYIWLDYREVRRLRLDVQNTKFTTYQSPLYHDPNVTYKNVKYGKEE